MVPFAEVIGSDDSEPEYRNVDRDIAYILYTSGSTGTPKGVMVSHLNIANYVSWATEFFGITSQDVILSTAPFHFDMSTFDVYCSMKSGARLVIAPEEMLLFPAKLLAFANNEGVTLWKGVSSLLAYIARTGSLERLRLDSMKRIVFAGEVLPTKYLIEWMRKCPSVRFYNAYGPTEATGISTCYEVAEMPRHADERIPIGKACANSEVIVEKEDGSQGEQGDVGELLVRGSGVASGYWNDVEKTKAAFVRNPFGSGVKDVVYRTGDLVLLREDGNLEFIGRKDDQVKWMGYRIELGEIESALLSLPNVKDAAVLLERNEMLKTEELVGVVEVVNDRDLVGVVEELKLEVARPHGAKEDRPGGRYTKIESGKEG